MTGHAPTWPAGPPLRRRLRCTLPILASAALGLRVPIALRPYIVASEGAPLEVVGTFERKLLDSADVESAHTGEIVARFAGRAGPFSYRTREIARFTERTVTFEHLDGPFHSCLERFVVQPQGDASSICHDGTFTMRWGLAGWLFGIIVVRPLFEKVVASELDRMTGSGQGDHPMPTRGGHQSCSAPDLIG